MFDQLNQINMDLMLSNFVVNSSPKVPKALETFVSNTKIVKNGVKKSENTEFSITLSKSAPKKALLARKRAAVKTQPADAKTSIKTIQAQSGSSEKTPQKKVSNQFDQSSPRKAQKTVANGNINAVSKRYVSKSANANTKVQTIETEHKNDEEALKRKGTFDLQSRSTNRPVKSSILERFKMDLPKLDLPKVEPLKEQVFSDQTIDTLEIHPHSKKNIADLLLYTRLTLVQSMAIPRLMEGRDALIRAQTGSGKTFAYALPMIEQLHNMRPKTTRTDGILAVVIVPTRELALQTYELMIKLLKPYTWIVSGYLCGGEKRKAEKARLRAGLNILIGTPGRFCDHIRNTECLKLNGVRWLVLDEADRLLELGYEKDVKEIVNAIQESSNSAGKNGNESANDRSLQTVLLSATLTTSVKELAGLTLHNPVYLETSDAIRERQTKVKNQESADYLLNVDECVSIPLTVKQRYLVIPPKLRLVTLSGLIALEQQKKPSKALIFMATQDLVDFHYNTMVEVLTLKQLESDDEGDDDQETDDIILPGVAFFKLHGGMTQVERSAVFLKFRSSKAAVLLCTDMVARGIDIPCVDLVVQYHAPQILADYVHRVGRTARAGHTGKAILFIEPAEVNFIKYLAEKQIRIHEQKIDGFFVLLAQRLKCGQKTIAKNKEQAAILLQHRFEQLVSQEKQLFVSASKAFVSWVRYYSNFPKELRRIFSIKAIHMGHYAQCLGLRDAPKQLMQSYTGPDDDASSQPGGSTIPNQARRNSSLNVRKGGKIGSAHRTVGKSSEVRGQARRTAVDGQAMADFAKRSRVLNTSEFDSGLAPKCKKFKT